MMFFEGSRSRQVPSQTQPRLKSPRVPSDARHHLLSFSTLFHPKGGKGPASANECPIDPQMPSTRHCDWEMWCYSMGFPFILI